MTFIPHVPPEQMTPRARLYLMATTLYCLGVGLSCLFVPHRFHSQSFDQIKAMLPGELKGWAAVHVALALTSFYAAWRGNEKYAFRALMGATMVIGPWAAGFWWTVFHSPTTAPTGVAAYTFITLVHLIQARQPLRSPFDPVLRSLPGAE